ncbi:hypothetical protein C8J56DRAFT_1020178 [Mycena floridula]|nr:hypothetical protein C8J56DRAFT_1020178 [Mycena floridula]
MANILTTEMADSMQNMTGRWYGRGFGAQAFLQAVRKYVVKIIELSLWSSDLLLGHLLLLMLSPPLLIPGFDRLHAVMLFWLRPSKQIRASLYSMKQSSQRRAILIKYGIVLLALTFFILMIVLHELIPFFNSFSLLLFVRKLTSTLQRRHSEHRYISTVRCVIFCGRCGPLGTPLWLY